MVRTSFIIGLLLGVTVCKVPLYFTLGLSEVNNGALADEGRLKYQLTEAKNLGSRGVIVDLWWGEAEPQPEQYRFGPYVKIAEICASLGLELQFTLSFHGCHDNDYGCSIRLPEWVRSVSNIWYKGPNGYESREYISLFADDAKVFGNRTPMQAYKDFAKNFASALWKYLGNTVRQVQVGLGPSGQLRYPSYDYTNFCGVGRFVLDDVYAKQSLEREVKYAKVGKSIQSLSFSSTSNPENSGFFSENKKDQNGFRSRFGKHVAVWYSLRLLNHGARILRIFREALPMLSIGAKLSAVHWTAGSNLRAPEITAGYAITKTFNFYDRFAKICKANKVVAVISGVEMVDNFDRDHCFSRGGALFNEVKAIAKKRGVEVMGETAWQRNDQHALDVIALQAFELKSLNFLRITEYTNQEEYIKNRFRDLVQKLNKLIGSQNNNHVESADKQIEAPQWCDTCRQTAQQKLMRA